MVYLVVFLSSLNILFFLPYGIISNGEKWQACTAEGKLDVPIGENAVVANGFRCYKEGERWRWVKTI